MFQQVQGQNIHGRTADRVATTTTDGAKERLDVSAALASALIPFAFDFISFSPATASPTTILFKSGGSGGTTVATLTIVYGTNGTDISTVTRT